MPLSADILWKLRDLSPGYGNIIQEAVDEIERLRERLGPRGLEVVGIDGIGHYVNEKVKAEIERLRGGENWCRYASYEILRQAVIELRRSGGISDVTTEKAKKLFREIKTGYEEVASHEDVERANEQTKAWRAQHFVDTARRLEQKAEELKAEAARYRALAVTSHHDQQITRKEG